MGIRSWSVHGIRAALLAVVRLVGAGLVLWGAYKIANRLLFAVLGNGDIESAWKVWMGTGETHGVFSGVPMVAIGSALAVWGRGLVRWVVRPAEAGCPRCGFAVEGGQEVCPECGQRVLDR